MYLFCAFTKRRYAFRKKCTQRKSADAKPTLIFRLPYIGGMTEPATVALPIPTVPAAAPSIGFNSR